MQYVLFKYIISEVRMEYLYVNNSKNVKARFEILHNINKKALVIVKENDKQLFL